MCAARTRSCPAIGPDQPCSLEIHLQPPLLAGDFLPSSQCQGRYDQRCRLNCPGSRHDKRNYFLTLLYSARCGDCALTGSIPTDVSTIHRSDSLSPHAMPMSRPALLPGRPPSAILSGRSWANDRLRQIACSRPRPARSPGRQLRGRARTIIAKTTTATIAYNCRKRLGPAHTHTARHARRPLRSLPAAERSQPAQPAQSVRRAGAGAG